MKKIFITAIILLIVNTFFGQSEKQVVFMDSNGKIIASRDIKRADSNRQFLRVIENDTAIIKILQPRKHEIILNVLQFTQLKMLLKKIIGNSYDERKNTMIHLYRKADTNEDENYSQYWNYIALHSDKLQAYLIGTKNSGIKRNFDKNIYIDTYDMLNNMFFKDSPYDLNHIYIGSNGEISYFYGLEDILWILDWSI